MGLVMKDEMSETLGKERYRYKRQTITLLSKLVKVEVLSMFLASSSSQAQTLYTSAGLCLGDVNEFTSQSLDLVRIPV